MKRSIRIRMVVILAALTVGTIVLFWCMNRFLLPSYYEKSKLRTMGNVYLQADDICKDVDWDEETDSDSTAIKQLDALGANTGTTIYIFRLTQNQMLWFVDYLYPVMNGMQQDIVHDRLAPYLSGSDTERSRREKVTTLRKSDNYSIYKVYDERIESNYIELFGVLNSGYNIYVRSNYQSITASTQIVNKFLIYIGLVVTLIGVIIMYFVSKSFTKPILQLADHAKSMTELKFDEKYEVTREDEIGTLGKAMNVLSSELEQTISELKTANNELRRDIARKEKDEEMRREFLANVSHELKTPIALIQGYAEGLQENISNDEQSRDFYCEVIVDEANKMNRMVKRLLDLNQIEFGSNQVQFDRFNIYDVINSVLSSTDILFKQKDVILNYKNSEPVYVWADEYMIEEVVTNYVSNALNHVNGDKKIEIKVVPMEDSVRVSVFNTGIAIPEEEIDKIWTKFYKVDKARTREYGGNGIGLSIVKAIMESMNQKYGVINYSNGVEFYFELDIKNVD